MTTITKNFDENPYERKSTAIARRLKAGLAAAVDAMGELDSERGVWARAWFKEFFSGSVTTDGGECIQLNMAGLSPADGITCVQVFLSTNTISVTLYNHGIAYSSVFDFDSNTAFWLRRAGSSYAKPYGSL